jgi:predicted transcriptional regulator
MAQRPTLGPLEVRVLGLLRAEEPAAVAAVRERLAAEGEPLAYTTVMTVLTRLHEKGLVRRSRDGNRFLYVPAAGASRVLGGLLTRVRRALFTTGAAQPLLALLETEDLSAEELRALRKAIDRRLKERGP